MSILIDTLMENIEVALEDAEPEEQIDLIDRLILALESRKRDIENNTEAPRPITVSDLIDYLSQLNQSTPVVQSEDDFIGKGDVVILGHVFHEING